MVGSGSVGGAVPQPSGDESWLDALIATSALLFCSRRALKSTSSRSVSNSPHVLLHAHAIHASAFAGPHTMTRQSHHGRKVLFFTYISHLHTSSFILAHDWDHVFGRI